MSLGVPRAFVACSLSSPMSIRPSRDTRTDRPVDKLLADGGRENYDRRTLGKIFEMFGLFKEVCLIFLLFDSLVHHVSNCPSRTRFEGTLVSETIVKIMNPFTEGDSRAVFHKELM